MHSENDLIDFRRENSFENIGDPNLSLIQWTFVGLIFVGWEICWFDFCSSWVELITLFLILFNMGATHNFVTKKVFATLGVQVNKCPSKMKVIKSQLQTIYGIAYEVQFWARNLLGNVDCFVVWLEDFEAILGIDFLISEQRQ